LLRIYQLLSCQTVIISERSNAIQIAKSNEAQQPIDAGVPIQPQFEPPPFQPPQFEPPPFNPPMMPNGPPKQDVGEGTYLVQSITRVTDLAAVTNSVRGYGYNDGICIFAAWAGVGQSVIMGSPLNADTDYVFLAAGDDDARIIGLEIINPFGNMVAWDRRDNPSAMVTFRPAWKKWGTARIVKPGTVILHSRADDVIPFADSEELAKYSGATLIEVGTDHRLADQEPLEAMLKACESR